MARRLMNVRKVVKKDHLEEIEIASLRKLQPDKPPPSRNAGRSRRTRNVPPTRSAEEIQTYRVP